MNSLTVFSTETKLADTWSSRRGPSTTIPVLLLFLLAAKPSSSQQSPLNTQTITLNAGVPLRIRTNRTRPLKVGARVEGVLSSPVYVHDRLVLPEGEKVRGRVIETKPTDRLTRTKALLDGDFTPLHEPVVDFDNIHITAINTDVVLNTRALIRNTQLARFIPVSKRKSFFHRFADSVSQIGRATRDAFFSPGLADRATRLVYNQLPYHPQRIWRNTQFTADLQAPTVFNLPFQPSPALSTASSLEHLDVKARLADSISSETAHRGDPVTAIVTEPIFDSNHQLVLPEGAKLTGTVLQGKPAESFGRNGELRFVFTGLEHDGITAQRVHGSLSGAAGEKAQNLTVDDEGSVQANPDKFRFVAPVLLAILATGVSENGNSIARNTVSSNGFGLAARVIALTVNDKYVATGFGVYALAKSVSFRFLTKGHQVSFPKDTLVEVEMSSR